MLTADADALPKAERAFISALLTQAPGLANGIAVAKRMNLLLRKKSEETLTQVPDGTVGAPLAELAASLRCDLAVLDLPWTTSPAEGQISRLKMLKRAVYDRAGFQLLQAT